MFSYVVMLTNNRQEIGDLTSALRVFMSQSLVDYGFTSFTIRGDTNAV